MVMMKIVYLLSVKRYIHANSLCLLSMTLCVHLRSVSIANEALYLLKTMYLLSEMFCMNGNGVCLLFMKFCMDLLSVYLFSVKCCRMKRESIYCQ